MGRRKLSIAEYRERMALKYGEGITEDFDAVFSGDITLAQISRKYKLSKMRATQFFERLYGVTFREAAREGSVTDPEGTLHTFEIGKNKQFVLILPEEMHDKLKNYSEKMGVPMSVVVRDSISDFFNKDKLYQFGDIFSI